jgi:hypothetical protein
MRHHVRHVTQGVGDPKKVALLMWENGIGDDVASMPGIAQKIADGYKVTIYTAPFRVPMWRSRYWQTAGLDVRAYGCEQFGMVARLRQEFGEIFALSQWCLYHDEETSGASQKDRVTQFADAIGVVLDVRSLFDYRKALCLPSAPSYGHWAYVLVALTASNERRDYPHRYELLSALRQAGSSFGYKRVRSVGKADEGSEVAEDVWGLIEMVRNASVVVSVDTGVLALSVALGRPTVALMGPTGASVVIEGIRRQQCSARLLQIVRGKPSSCQLPCNFHVARGFGRGNTCSLSQPTECMTSIKVEDVIQAFYAIERGRAAGHQESGSHGACYAETSANGDAGVCSLCQP